MDKKLYDMTLSELKAFRKVVDDIIKEKVTLSELKAFRKVVDDVIKEKKEERREREISIQRVDAQVKR